jgi:myosin heavy subunit
MTTAAVGEPIWLLIPGEGNEERGIGPGGIHQAKVTAANDSEGTVDVKRDGDGAEFKGVSMSTPQRCKEWPDDVKEGDGIAIACDFESNFPENGFVDMTEMEKLNDAELARNLEKLYFRDQSYCWCGAALVAMNLMKKIDIYSHTQLDSYQSVVNPRVDLDPHVWGVAGSCYKKLFEKKIVESSMIGKSGSVLRNHQAIIITGESGAGKSFTTKKVLDFIAAAGQHRESSFDHMSNTRDSGTSVSLANTPEGKQSVTNRMLATTPILEAYGNAAMPRNNDSSRFGKLYKVYFHPGDQHITGCEIEPYLLEKSV